MAAELCDESKGRVKKLMNILVTGAHGFIGKNLISELKSRGYKHIFEVTRNTDPSLLEHYADECDFVFHLAGVNRPDNEQEFFWGNADFTARLADRLRMSGRSVPVLMSSSIQAERDHAYGRSKKEGESSLFKYGAESGAEVYVYRLPNVFGKWSRPYYNSVVATFCHNIARELDIQIHDPDVELQLCYIDDVVDEFIRAMEGNAAKKDDFCSVPVVHSIKLGSLAKLLYSFKESRTTLNLPNLGEPLNKKLYSTYLSFLPESQFAYDLKMHTDQRGSFTEFIRTPERGQVSVNVSKPGITKGNHWHHTKNEKFLVVSGEGLIRFRKIDSEDIIEYRVSGTKLQVVDIPVGYTHSIVNVGDSDMVTVMWANECYDPERPDTFFLEV